MTETIHLSLPFIDAAQAQKHVTHNEALQLLDAATQLSAVARDQTTPPGSPAEGDRYLVGAGASGAFAGKDGQVATWLAGAWIFLAPKAGWLLYVAAEDRVLLHDGSAWRDAGYALKALQNVELLGVGTTADAFNPFALKANAALLAAKAVGEGGDGDLRIALSKESAGGTLSQLYQTGYSGRAETGLVGDDDFHVKVSADGATWREAILVDRTTGRVSFPSGVGDGSLAGFRNRLRNASFAINQRVVSGTVTLAAGVYGHDGVKAGASGCAYTFSTSGLDTTLTITAGSLVLPIESALIEGGIYVLTHAGTAQARVWQGTGYTGSGSYADVPSTGLVSTGLSASTQTNVEFSTGTVLRPQLEAGSYPTSFERRPPGVELALCQRYYEKSYKAAHAPGATGQAGYARDLLVATGNLSSMIGFGVTKYSAPTVTLYSNVTGASGYVYDTSAATDAALAAIYSVGQSSFSHINAVGVAAGHGVNFHWTASAEI